MNPVIFWFCVYTVCVIAHWLFAQYLGFFGSAPSVLFAGVVAGAVAFGPVAALTFAFAAGLFADFLAVQMFGGYALAFVLAAYITWYGRGRIDFTALLPRMVFTGALTVFYLLFYMAASWVFLEKSLLVSWPCFLLTPIYNALLAALVFPFFAIAPARKRGGNISGML